MFNLPIAYYLPHPGEQQYQFRYVDQQGTVKGISEPFVISEPRQMEDLVTLEDEEASLDMILVVSKSAFLQVTCKVLGLPDTAI